MIEGGRRPTPPAEEVSTPVQREVLGVLRSIQGVTPGPIESGMMHQLTTFAEIRFRANQSGAKKK